VHNSAYGLELISDEREWLAHANCTPDTAEWFWITGPGRERRLSADNKMALALCRDCPVIRQCYRHAAAQSNPEPHIAGGHVWGVR